MTDQTTATAFILRGWQWGSRHQESFDTLDEALDDFASVRYHGRDDGAMFTPWWPEEILLPDGTVIDENEIEKLRPDW